MCSIRCFFVLVQFQSFTLNSNSIMEYTQEMRKSQCMNIANTLNQNTLSDVTFIVGEEHAELKGNRFLLAAISDVFKAMLFGLMEEGKPNAEVTIDDIDADAFQSVLNWAYCADPKVNRDNVVSVKHICRKYQIHSLSAVCDSFFDTPLDVDTICF